MADNEQSGARLLDYLKSWPLYPLPHHLLSRMMLALTRAECKSVVPAAIRFFCNRFNVDLSEAVETDPAAYPFFNAFFTRALKEGARPIDADTNSIASPADGAVSQAGPIVNERVFQAKGRDYSLVELLGGSVERAAPFQDGDFTTIYLSPRDYHRVHMPIDGTLRETVYVPGRLFSVAPHTVRAVPSLFARNERYVAIFDTPAGPMAMILVGAIFVACIETVWDGVVTPPRHPSVMAKQIDDSISLKKGDEMGRFNMGSTVILLFGKDQMKWLDSYSAEHPLKMGEAIGQLAS